MMNMFNNMTVFFENERASFIMQQFEYLLTFQYFGEYKYTQKLRESIPILIDIFFSSN